MPAKSTNTTVTVIVADNDDLNPKFTRDVYRTRIYEFYPMAVSIDSWKLISAILTA